MAINRASTWEGEEFTLAPYAGALRGSLRRERRDDEPDRGVSRRHVRVEARRWTRDQSPAD